MTDLKRAEIVRKTMDMYKKRHGPEVVKDGYVNVQDMFRLYTDCFLQVLEERR